MRKLLKKLTAFLLAVMLFASMLPISSSAAGTWKNPFTDVTAGDWYYNAVKYTNYYGYISGMSKTRFGPGTTTSREMFVTILGRMMGVDAEAYKGKNQFTDVKSAWSEPYIAWAAENEIVSGIGNGKFNPQGAVTREQSATILYNYLVARGYTPTIYENALGAFDDVAKISSYAKVPMQWIVSAGIINGDGSGSVKPAGTASRAQIAQILWKFNDHVAVLDGKEPLELPEDGGNTPDKEDPKADPNNIFKVFERDFDSKNNWQVSSKSRMDQGEQAELIELLKGKTGNAVWNDIALNGFTTGNCGYARNDIVHGPDGSYTVKKTTMENLVKSVKIELENTPDVKYFCVSLGDDENEDGTPSHNIGLYYFVYFINTPSSFVNPADSTLSAKVKEKVARRLPAEYVWSQARSYGGGYAEYYFPTLRDSDGTIMSIEKVSDDIADWYVWNLTEGWQHSPASITYYIELDMKNDYDFYTRVWYA